MCLPFDRKSTAIRNAVDEKFGQAPVKRMNEFFDYWYPHVLIEIMIEHSMAKCFIEQLYCGGKRDRPGHHRPDKKDIFPVQMIAGNNGRSGFGDEV